MAQVKYNHRGFMAVAARARSAECAVRDCSGCQQWHETGTAIELGVEATWRLERGGMPDSERSEVLADLYRSREFVSGEAYDIDRDPTMAALNQLIDQLAAQPAEGVAQ